jgi:hypothetical protein
VRLLSAELSFRCGVYTLLTATKLGSQSASGAFLWWMWTMRIVSTISLQHSITIAWLRVSLHICRSLFTNVSFTARGRFSKQFAEAEYGVVAACRSVGPFAYGPGVGVINCGNPLAAMPLSSRPGVVDCPGRLRPTTGFGVGPRVAVALELARLRAAIGVLLPGVLLLLPPLAATALLSQPMPLLLVGLGCAINNGPGEGGKLGD